MRITRKGFLKLAGITAAGAAVGADKCLAHTAPSGDTYGVLTDLTLCVGCRSCERACSEVNELPEPDKPFTDLSVLETKRRMSTSAFTVVNAYRNARKDRPKIFEKIQCMHCNDPACVSACLVGAMQKTPEGPVIWEGWRCMGCRYCMVACPFGVPTFEYDKGIEPRIRKCTMCHPRIKEGKIPGCVEACPVEALKFGKRKDLIEYARERIRKNPGRYVDRIYGERVAGGTGWMYIAPQEFSSLGFLELPDDPPPRLTEGIQHAIFKFFIPPVLLYGTLGAVMKATQGKDEEAPPEKKPDEPKGGKP